MSAITIIFLAVGFYSTISITTDEADLGSSSLGGRSDSLGGGQQQTGSGGALLQSPIAADSNLDLPEWMVCGESVVLRQSNYSGIIAFIGTTDFASGLWIGIELDAPLGNVLHNPMVYYVHTICTGIIIILLYTYYLVDYLFNLSASLGFWFDKLIIRFY